jgi:integrase
MKMSNEKSKNPKPQKTKSRGNGEGSIYKRSDGRWCGAITVGRNENGTFKKRVIYGKNRNEVAEKMSKELHDIQISMYVEPNKITMEQWLETWLYEYKKSSVRPTTFESYEYIVRVHINPKIGRLYLKDLKAEQLQKLYNEKFSKGRSDGKGGLSSRTVRYIHILIHEALDQAVMNNLISKNVSEFTKLPMQKKAEMRVLTAEEQQKFLNALDDERLRASFILALGSGVRLGELLALRWKDVDFNKGIISINRTVKRTKTFDNEENKSVLLIQEPKTKSGKRQIPLPASVITELKEHRKLQLQERLLAGLLYIDNDLLFSTEIGKLLEPSNFIRKFKSLIKKAGLENVNFHALRHSYATRLLEENEHPKVVQELLGHSDIKLTLNTYSHVMPEIKIAAANKIDHLFNKNLRNYE